MRTNEDFHDRLLCSGFVKVAMSEEAVKLFALFHTLLSSELVDLCNIKTYPVINKMVGTRKSDPCSIAGELHDMKKQKMFRTFRTPRGNLYVRKTFLFSRSDLMKTLRHILLNTEITSKYCVGFESQDHSNWKNNFSLTFKGKTFTIYHSYLK